MVQDLNPQIITPTNSVPPVVAVPPVVPESSVPADVPEQPVVPNASPPLVPPNPPALPLPPLNANQPKKKSSKKVILFAAMLAILVAVGVTGFLLMNGKPKTESSTSTTPVVAKETPATTADVDQTSQAVDTAIKQADSADDVGSNDLTDATLGL